MELLSYIEIGSEINEEAPAVEMNLKIGNMKGMGAVEKKSVIAGKLHQYLKKRHPDCHHQLHSHLIRKRFMH